MSDITVDKNKYIFTWLIEDFTLCRLSYFNAEEIRSPLFTTDHIGQASWFLTISGVKTNKDIYRGECSLVRYSEDEGSETIRIHWKLNVTSQNKRYCVEDERDGAIIDGFKKGYSCTGCKLLNSSEHESKDNITLECQITEFSSAEKPVSKSSAVRSKVDGFTWYPQYLSESKLLCGLQNTQYELFFHVSDDDKLVKIRRLDCNNLIECYVSYGLKINDEKANARNALKIPLFKVNDICDVSSSVNYLLNKKFINYELCIYGTLITSILVEGNCSAFAGKQCNFAGINPSLKLDSTEIFRNNVRIYEDKKHTDIQLKIGCESFSAHKCFLSATSPVFSTMFDQDMVENQTGVVNITDMDEDTLKLFLKYIYTTTIEELHCQNALKLLTAAEKYQIFSLKEKCATYLLNNLSEENICEILVVADMTSCSELKNSAMDFVKANAKKVLLSEGWKQFVKENANLVAETLVMISEEFGTAK